MIVYILIAMKTVQMTLDESLVSEVDRVARRLKTTRSALTRVALQRELKRVRDLELEKRHREGYLKKPVQPHEFGKGDDDDGWPAW
jgi:metal-responsive CopG/Arc/MetJ family transcriptional regulator